jgi:RNA polymerase sigma-70 factor (ECF subfamily)
MAADAAHAAVLDEIGLARNHTPRSKTEIVEGVIAGERWAHAGLYDLLLPVVARTLRRLLRDAECDYQDLVQTSFERIVSGLVKSGGDVLNVNQWAGAIAARVAIDALRGRIRERRLFRPNDGELSTASDPAGPDPDGQLDARRQLDWLQGALARMKPQQAEVLILCDVLGHDLREAGELAGVSASVAQRRLSRARKELLRRADARDEGGRA